MWSPRTLSGLVLGAALAAAASAQTPGALRWHGHTPLQLGAPSAVNLGAGIGCGAIGPACEAESASTPLWVSNKAPRAVLVEVTQLEPYSLVRPQGLNLSVVGKAGLPNDLGVYGRIGTSLLRSGPGLHPAAAGEAVGMSYGMGLSWDFSRRGSASVGLDGYDLRTPGGDWRASLGLKWSY